MRTTKKQFEQFKAEFLRWQERLGLSEWAIYFKRKPMDGAYASVTANTVGRVVTVCFNSNQTDSLDAVASGKHEALELLLAQLDAVCRARFINLDELDESRHAIIRRLEKVL